MNVIAAKLGFMRDVVVLQELKKIAVTRYIVLDYASKPNTLLRH
jgi:hypothetical protein